MSKLFDPSWHALQEKANAGSEREKLRVRVNQLETALRVLVDKLDVVHNSDDYMQVCGIAQVHVGPYNGPTYIEELERAKQVLEGGAQ